MNYNKDKFLSILNKLKESFGSQNKMAEALGISSSYITKIYDENTKNPPAPEYLKKIADNSKGVTTYDELMEVCGYKEESIESYTYNSYNKLRKFEKFLQEKENEKYVINVETVIQDFLKYLDILKNNIYEEGEDEYGTIFLYDIFRENFLLEEYGYISGFMLLYDDFIKYFEKNDIIQIIDYTFLDWFKIENIYSILKNFNKIELLSYNCKIIKLINDNIDISEIDDKIRNFANCISLALLSDSDNNILSEFFKYKANGNNTNTNTNDNTLSTTKDSATYNTIKIPVLGSIPAGVPVELIQDIIDYEDISEEMLKGGKEYFALKVKGSSMWPKYLDGDTIIVLKQDDCESGQDAIVMVNGNDGTFKRIIKKDNGITLEPINQQEYNSISYSNEDIEKLPIKILGVVKEIRRKI